MADYFTDPLDPVTNSAGESSVIRSVFALIAAGFAKIAGYTGNGGKLVAINAGATAQEAITTASGILTFLGTPSSANLRAALTDESGTGVAYFQGGDLGTPSAGVGTNLTGTAAGLTAGNVTTNANLTGPVTSVGNATAIADKAIALAKLADGTAGNVVTYSAAGVITVAATGSAGEVFTSNGAGAAPTFQTGSASIVFNDATYWMGV